MKQDQFTSNLNEDTAIRAILEGTAASLGEEFFASLVKSLAGVLGVAAAWVTEYKPETKRLRALSFWFSDHYVSDYEYAIHGTPCESVVESRCLVHIPDGIVQLFPEVENLKAFGVVSYMGAPLLDTDGTVLGHLGIMDMKPMPREKRLESLFQIFAARSTAEQQRIHAEAKIHEREQQLSSLLNGAMDAILELDEDLRVRNANPAAARAFGCSAEAMIGRSLGQFLRPESKGKLAMLARDLAAGSAGNQSCWIPAGLEAVGAGSRALTVEGSLSRFQAHGRNCYTVILRDIQDRLDAERKIEALSSESAYLKEEIDQEHNFHELLGRSPVMAELRRSIQQVAGTDATVLIQGETGTGKELVARALHAASRRAQKPLIKVNCAAIPASLIESEFFGHEKGAFTGATQKREGRFALADSGTIFLDEVGELPLDLQSKLLRVLQEGEFEPVGSSRTRAVDVRVIAATNRDLSQEIREGKFRQDLYYRLHVFPIRVPPLRERRGDVGTLAAAFGRKFSQKIGCPLQPLSREDINLLNSYHWPGNVRELENVMERAVITARNGVVNLEMALPLSLTDSFDDSERNPSAREEPAGMIWTALELQEFERQNIVRALKSTGWRVAGEKGAAHLLGMPSSTLSSRMKALGIKRPH